MVSSCAAVLSAYAIADIVERIAVLTIFLRDLMKDISWKTQKLNKVHAKDNHSCLYVHLLLIGFSYSKFIKNGKIND